MRTLELPIMPLALSVTLAALAAPGCSGLATGQDTVKVKQTAPEIAGIDQQNQPVSLRKLNARGSVLVVFYRGHF